MQRRKFVIGAGALFAGSAAGVGTGAFSKAESGPRTVTVNQVDDSDALLGMQGADNRFGDLLVDDSGDEIQLNFGKQGGASPTNSVNKGSTYWFDRVLAIYVEGANQSVGNAGPNTEATYKVTVRTPPGLFAYLGSDRDDAVVDKILKSDEGDQARDGDISDLDPDELLEVGFRVKEEDFNGGSIEVIAERQ